MALPRIFQVRRRLCVCVCVKWFNPYPKPVHVVRVREAHGIEADITSQRAIELGGALEEGDSLALLHPGSDSLGGCADTDHAEMKCVTTNSARGVLSAAGDAALCATRPAQPRITKRYRGYWCGGGTPPEQRPRPRPGMPGLLRRGGTFLVMKGVTFTVRGSFCSWNVRRAVCTNSLRRFVTWYWGDGFLTGFRP